MKIAAISIISISFLALAKADETNKGCPKYLSLTGIWGKYRLVAKGAEGEFKTCNGDIANCVFTHEMKFYCMSGMSMGYKPTEVKASYENLKENVTRTSFGKAGGEKFEIDLTGTNTAIRMRLYQMDVEVRSYCYCT